MSDKLLPYTIDREGRRVFNITGAKGILRKTSQGRPGDLIVDGRKTYEIQKSGAFKRLDKKRKQ